MLTAEVDAAVDRPLRGLLQAVRSLLVPERDPRPSAPVDDVIRVLARRAEWDGPGTVRLDGDRLVFEDDARASRTSLKTIRSVEHEDEHIWIRRRRAHDWLVRFEDAEDAAHIEAVLRATI